MTAGTVLESMVASMINIEPLWPHIADIIKDSVDFDWISLTGFYLHVQRTEDGIVRGASRISLFWRCKWKKKKSLNEASRPEAAKRKLYILSHQ